MEERALCAGMTYEVWGGEAWGGGRFVQVWWTVDVCRL